MAHHTLPILEDAGTAHSRRFARQGQMQVGSADTDKKPAQASAGKLRQPTGSWWSKPPLLLPQYLPDGGQGLPKPRTALHGTPSTPILSHQNVRATPSRTPAATLQYRPARAGLLLHLKVQAEVAPSVTMIDMQVSNCGG